MFEFISQITVGHIILALSALALILEIYIRMDGTEYDSRARTIKQSIQFVLGLIRGSDLKKDDSIDDVDKKEILNNIDVEESLEESIDGEDVKELSEEDKGD